MLALLLDFNRFHENTILETQQVYSLLLNGALLVKAGKPYDPDVPTLSLPKT